MQLISGCEFCEHRAIIDILANSYLTIVKATDLITHAVCFFVRLMNLLKKHKDAQT